jgi:hypothetical protein
MHNDIDIYISSGRADFDVFVLVCIKMHVTPSVCLLNRYAVLSSQTFSILLIVFDMVYNLLKC